MAKRSCWALIVTLALLVSLGPAPAVADDDGPTVEVGVEWVGKYSGSGGPSAGYGDLYTTDEAVRGLGGIVEDPGTSWRWGFDNGTANAFERHWKAQRLGGLALSWADDVDLVAFSGHGIGNTLEFAVENADWRTTVGDLDLGLRDCEWMLAFTCNFLKGTPADYGPIANGVHLVCGYATDMTVTSNAGQRFAYYATAPYGVRVAWYKYGLSTQSSAWKNTARTFGATAARNDYLWGYGAVAGDPPSYLGEPSAYSYWDTRLNW